MADSHRADGSGQAERDGIGGSGTLERALAADWDAARYHRISAPQFDWGQRVIARLAPAAGERILDLGCGTGRLTQQIAGAAAGGRIVGVDVSGAMLAVARVAAGEAPGAGVAYVQASGVALPFRGGFDAVFSAATLHWIQDHDAVYREIFTALRPGGRFVAQCGGKGNLDRLLAHTASVMAAPAYAPYFRGWREPWHFAGAAPTTGRLLGAGFSGAEAWIEEAPTDLGTAEAFAEFVSCVCIRHHLDRLPLALREPFVAQLTDRAAGGARPFVLDYQRLNISATKAAR
jgi:trans-aconitate 2-methyltransferase